jgi:hypothetical protein
LFVFRLKAKEPIHTVLYRCHLLEYTTLITPKHVILVAIACDIHGTLPAKSRLRPLLKYGWSGYGFDAPRRFG